MESIETELCVERSKSDRKGRRIRSPQEWAQILERYDASGLTQEAFCGREGIRFGTLVAWLGRRRRRGGQLCDPKPAPSKFHELRLTGADCMHSREDLRVSLPDGTCVSGSNAEELARLVLLLKGATDV